MKKNASRRMFILVMIMTVIVVFVMTRRESYNPWLPWNWFRKPEPPRPYPMPERPYPMPEPPRPRCHPLSLDPRCRAIDPSELIFSNRPAQPISPGVRARMQSR